MYHSFHSDSTSSMKNNVVRFYRRAEDTSSGVLPPIDDTLLNTTISTNTTDTLFNTTNNTSPLSQRQQQQPTNRLTFSSPSDQTANILAVGLMIVFFYFCCQRRQVPGPEHWRGAEMRRNYLEMLARERAKEQRETQTPEYRQRLVTHNMRTKVRHTYCSHVAPNPSDWVHGLASYQSK